MKKIYCIYDVVAKEYNDSFMCCPNDGVATRLYNQTLKKVPDELKNDLRLFCLGKFYSNNGKIFSEVTEVVPTNEGCNLDDVVAEIEKEVDDEPKDISEC